MESLAYLHAALAASTSVEFESHFQAHSLRLFRSWQNLSSRVAFGLLNLITTCALVTVAQTAIAQTYNQNFSLPPIPTIPIAPTPTPRVVPSFNAFPTAAVNRPTLRFGSNGEDVRFLQNLLRQYGCFSANSTGFFRELTEEAVILCQQRLGITADGIVGPQTWSALLGRNAVPSVPAFPNSAVNNFPATNSGFITRTLQRSDRGEDVRLLQQRLRELSFQWSDPGLDPGEIDGVFGFATEEAVRRVQTLYNIFPDGRVGSETLQVIGLPIADRGQNVPLVTVSADNPYIVAIPQTDIETLSRVRGYVSSAVISREPRRGNFINVGAYPNRSTAESVVQLLRTDRLDARVIYLPSRGR